MSERDLDEKPTEDGFWIKASASIAANIVSALLASGIIAVLVAGFVAFSRLTSKNAAAFRLLLAAAILGALMSLVSVLILTRYGRKAVTVGGRTARQVTELREDTASQIAALTRELAEKIDALDHQFPSIDWSFDAAEHDRSVYERMRKVVENDDTMHSRCWKSARPGRAAAPTDPSTRFSACSSSTGPARSWPRPSCSTTSRCGPRPWRSTTYPMRRSGTSSAWLSPDAASPAGS
jgi:hypothetical protein